jgi:RNA-directed DNA polymerase
MRQGVRQHLAGLVTNAKVNVMRTDFDALKATLTNCARQGPASQNREGREDFRAHLTGRVGFVESVNPVRGEKLRRILEQIHWD